MNTLIHQPAAPNPASAGEGESNPSTSPSPHKSDLSRQGGAPAKAEAGPLTYSLTHSLTDSIPASLAAALPRRKKRREKGKIAQLPQEQKDLINAMLDDGKSYKFIELEMAKLGVSLNGENISNWFTGPYQDYVRDCEWREDLLMLSQSVSALDGVSFGQKFQETLVQLAFVDIFRALKDPETRTDRLNHIRILNSLARLNREALNVRKYNDLRADKATDELQAATKTPSVEEAQHGIFCAFDHAMSLKPAPGPIGPDINKLFGLDGSSSLAAPNAASAGEGGSSNSSPLSASGKEVFRVESSEFDVRCSPSEIPLTGSPTHPPAPASDPTIQRFNDSTHLTPPSPTDPLTHLPAPVPHSNIEIQKPKMKTFREKCHECRVQLPPLLPSGERPDPHCRNCGTPLRDPGERHLYCPACQGSLHTIFNGPHRTSNECPHCAITLPPPPAPSTLSHTLSNTLSPPGTTPSTLAA